MPRGPFATPSAREIVTRTHVLRITVRPTPTPTPRPLPVTIIPPRATPRNARIVARSLQGRAGASASLRDALRPPFARSRATAARPVWDIAAGNGVSGAREAGNGAPAGSASGSGSQGNGTGVGPADEACGYVTFSDPHGSQFDPRTRGFFVDIRMSVHFADGSMQTTMLDYPWYYTSEAANPWSDRNAKDPNFPTRFQPPPSQKFASEPALVKYVADHSTPDGITMLQECPAPTPAVEGVP